MTLTVFHRYLFVKSCPPFPHLKCVQWADDKRINNIGMTCSCNSGYFYKEIWGIKNGLRKYSDIL